MKDIIDLFADFIREYEVVTDGGAIIGIRNSCKECPVAQFWHRLQVWDVTVAPRGSFINGRYYVHPEWMRRFIYRIDNNKQEGTGVTIDEAISAFKYAVDDEPPY